MTDDATPPPTPPAPPPLPPVPPYAATPQPPVPPYAATPYSAYSAPQLPEMAPADPPEPRRRGSGGRVGFVVGVVALIAVVAAGLATFLGSGSGAGSAEEAVRGLAKAAAAEDILGAAQYLPPSEVGSAPDLYDLAIKVLQKNKSLGSEGKPLAGVDIKVDDLELQTTMLGDRVGKVELVSGTLSAAVTAAEVDPEIRRSQEAGGDPVEDSTQSITVAEWREQLLDATSGIEISADRGGAISGLYLMAIKEDGRWYVSYQYTLMEYGRELAGAPLPEFGPVVQGEGVSSPEALLTKVVDELNGLDQNAIADAIEQQAAGTNLTPNTGFVNPRETQAMADYLPVFEGIMRELQGNLGVDPQDTAGDIADKIRELDISVQATADSEVKSLADGRSMVVLRSAEVTVSVAGTFDGEAVAMSFTLSVYDGTCGSFRLEAESGGDDIEQSGDSCADLFAGTDFRGFFFVAVKVDGSWYLSPVETIVQYVRYGLEAELAS